MIFFERKKIPLRPPVHSLGVNETFPTVGEEERDRLPGRGNIIGGGEMVIIIIILVINIIGGDEQDPHHQQRGRKRGVLILYNLCIL